MELKRFEGCSWGARAVRGWRCGRAVREEHEQYGLVVAMERPHGRKMFTTFAAVGW